MNVLRRGRQAFGQGSFHHQRRPAHAQLQIGERPELMAIRYSLAVDEHLIVFIEHEAIAPQLAAQRAMLAADFRLAGRKHNLTTRRVAADRDLRHVVAEFQHLARVGPALKMNFQRHAIAPVFLDPRRIELTREKA